MKTAIFISAALLLAASSFAQTTVNNNSNVKSATAIQADKQGAGVSGQTSTSASTSVQSNTPNKIESKTQSGVAKTKKQVVIEKEAVKASASNQEKALATTADNANVSADVHNKSVLAASEQSNKVAGNASLNGQAKVSTSAVKNTTTSVKTHSETAVAAAQNTTVKTTQAVKPMVQTIKPAPAAVKINSSIKTNAGIRIK